MPELPGGNVAMIRLIHRGQLRQWSSHFFAKALQPATPAYIFGIANVATSAIFSSVKSLRTGVMRNLQSELNEMRRRDLSKALVASAAGAAFLASRSQARAGADVKAESAAFVGAPNDVRGLDGAPDGTTDNSMPITRAQNVSGSSYFKRGTWRVGSNLTLDRAYAPIFEGLAVWKPDAEKTISIAGQITSAGNQRIFDLSNAHSAVRISNQVINAAWFGVVPDGNYATGEGSDNCPKLQQAINALAAAGGGALYVPPGIYLLSAQVTVPDGVTVYGAGKWSTILFASAHFDNEGGLIRIQGRNGNPTCFHGISVVGQEGGVGGVGVYSEKNGVFINDIWCSAFIHNPGIVLNQTDNFLSDFVVELCMSGVQVKQTHVTIANGRTYRNTAAGIMVANGGAIDEGRVTIDAVRSADDGEDFILVRGGKCVTASNCDATSLNNRNYSAAAYRADSATDVVFNACTGTLAAGTSTAAGVLVYGKSSKIAAQGCHLTGFQDGLRALDSKAVNVNGGNYSGNTRRGIYFAAGDQMICQGVNASGNGANSSGIHSDNCAAGGSHLITGNIANGQRFGITAHIGSARAVTNLVGNLIRGNTGKGIKKTGTVANINDIGNL
jgi:hypothetical protein